MAGTPIGTAYINIAPNMSGIQSKITAGLQGTGTAVSSQFGQETSGIGKLFGGVMSGVQAAAQGAALVIGGILTASLSGAISRVDTLNNASRVFQDMGFSADQVTQSTDALKKSILGLPTSLNDAISNVQLLASSTGDLSKAQKIFSALNDGILGFGGTTGDVSNAVLQLGQALAGGTINAQTWNSLLNSQLGPALNAIAKTMGITSTALKDGLSAGTISASDFENQLISLDQNGGGGLVSLQSLAQQATQGIGTSFANLHTALVRGMANIIQAVGAPMIAEKITAIGSAIEGVEGKIAKLITDFTQGGGTIGSALSGILPVVGLLAGSLGPLLTQIPVIGSLFTKLTGPIGLIVGLIAGMIAASPQLQAAIGTVFSQLAGTLKTLEPVISQVMSIFTGLLTTLGNALAPVLVEVGKAFTQIVEAIAPLIPPLLQVAVAIIQQILLPLLPTIVTLITLLASVFTQVMTALLPLLPQITGFAMLLITALAPILPQIANLLIQLITALMPLIPPLLQLVMLILPPLISLFTVLANIISAVLVAAITIAIGIVSDIVTLLGHLVNEIVNVIAFTVNLVGSVESSFAGIKNAAGDMVGNVVSWFASLPGKILSAVGGLGSVLYNAGASTIQGFLNGAESLLKTVGSFFISKLPGWIQGPFKSALGIHSPSTVFAGFGGNIVDGLVNGLVSNSSSVTAAVGTITDAAVKPLNSNIDPNVAVSGNIGNSSANGSGGGNTQTVTIGTVVLGTADAAKEFFNQLNQDTINVGMGLTPNQGAI